MHVPDFKISRMIYHFSGWFDQIILTIPKIKFGLIQFAVRALGLRLCVVKATYPGMVFRPVPCLLDQKINQNVFFDGFGVFGVFGNFPYHPELILKPACPCPWWGDWCSCILGRGLLNFVRGPPDKTWQFAKFHMLPIGSLQGIIYKTSRKWQKYDFRCFSNIFVRLWLQIGDYKPARAALILTWRNGSICGTRMLPKSRICQEAGFIFSIFLFFERVRFSMAIKHGKMRGQGITETTRFYIGFYRFYIGFYELYRRQTLK